MKAIIAILLCDDRRGAGRDGKPADQPITVYKGGKPYIYDGMRVMCRPTRGAPDSCPAAGEVSKPEVEKKPAPKGVG